VTQDLAELGAAFWAWRARTQPAAGDDIPRIERPRGWTPDWSTDAVAAQRQVLEQFELTWQSLGAEVATWPIPEQVDYRLIGSALARARWELDVLKGWRRNPNFYVHQTLGTVFEALLRPPPFDAQRSAAILERAESIPATLEAARANLADESLRPFADLAISALQDVRPRLLTVSSELEPYCGDELGPAMAQAADALESFRDWLVERAPHMPTTTAIGREAYAWFLNHVALMPLSPEQVMAIGQQELDRAVAFEAFEQQRNRDLPPLSLPASLADQIVRQAAGEQMLRQFCEEHDLLSFPAWLRRYRNLPMPAYLAPLYGLGVTDDLTSASRPDQDGISYIPAPAPDLPYFYLAMAQDPRTLIAHEGMHYYQLAQSWAHADPIRRCYYDSGPNEGIGFYAEEMLLQAGLFDDSPRSREIIYNFMRLRAIRVGVDARLALGHLTIESAAAELARRVPMDAATAYEEASFFASAPGQAITYQIGKQQIVGFLADARLAAGSAFSLREFHDRLWLNGNVPIALQRWEALGLRDQIDVLDTGSDRLPT
jgi:uncharacterized protein DUF885